MKQIIIGAIFIILGASGEFVLRGTNSPALLIIIGVIMLVIGIISMTTKVTEGKQIVPQEMTERQIMFAICKACANSKFDIKTGTSCGLTGEKPNFKERCPNFSKKV